jgi:hypothetical protein
MYAEKHVVHATNKRDARYDFAVAAFAVANSSVWQLREFYQEYRDQMVGLFGKDKVQKLFRKMKIRPLSKKPVHLETNEA